MKAKLISMPAHGLKPVFLLLFIMLAGADVFSQSGEKWATGGNASSAGDFLGTTTNQPLVFKTNNVQQMVMGTDGILRLSSLTGTGNRLLQTDGAGNLLPFNMGSSSHVLYGDGTWAPLPSLPNVFWNADYTGNNIFFNTGNVGIGNNNPLFPLDVTGDVRISNNLYVGGGIVITDKVNATAEVVTGKIETDSILTDSTKGFYGTTKFNDDVRLQSKLNVAGNVSFSGALKVGSLASSMPLQMVFVDNLGNLKLMGPSGPSCAGTMPWMTGGNVVATVAETYLGTCNNMPLRLGTNNFEQIRITETGRIGIGTSNPIAPFQVQMPTAFMSNVGIGTTSPVQRLQVDNGNELIRGDNNFNNSGDDAVVYLGDQYHYIKSINGAGVKIGTFGVTDGIFLQQSTGNVGIGTDLTSNTDNYRLAVNGNIRAKRVVVETGWADFVFEKSYKLRSLQEIENYISIYKHLPEIPNATEIETNGVDVGELLKLQMQKIEELTLYIIEQDKRIIALEKNGK